jgi:hypothetical protein
MSTPSNPNNPNTLDEVTVYFGGTKPGEPCMAATIVAIDSEIVEWLARRERRRRRVGIADAEGRLSRAKRKTSARIELFHPPLPPTPGARNCRTGMSARRSPAPIQTLAAG